MAGGHPDDTAVGVDRLYQSAARDAFDEYRLTLLALNGGFERDELRAVRPSASHLVVDPLILLLNVPA